MGKGFAIFVCCLAFVVQAAPDTCGPAIESADDCVVSLRIEKEDTQTGAVTEITATGFLVGKDGWILTAAHPLALSSESGQKISSIRGRLRSNRPPPEEEVRIDKILRQYDVALLQFKVFSQPRKVFVVGRTSDVRVLNDLLTVVGFPLTLPLDKRQMRISSKGGDSPMWNVDCNATFGLSGAPVLNDSGQVVAVMIGDDDRGHEVKYASPINLASELLGTAEAVYNTALPGSYAVQIRQFRTPYSWQDDYAPDEGRIIRSHSFMVPLPAGQHLSLANVTVQRQSGLTSKPAIEVSSDGRWITVSFDLESGPQSSGKRGSVDIILEMLTEPTA